MVGGVGGRSADSTTDLGTSRIDQDSLDIFWCKIIVISDLDGSHPCGQFGQHQVNRDTRALDNRLAETDGRVYDNAGSQL